MVEAKWDNKNFMLRDDWRRELADAAGFDPDRGAERLWVTSRLRAYLCASDHATTWLVADLAEIRFYRALKGRDPVARTQWTGLWRIPAGELIKGCGGKPSTVPK